jgi:hypothetical protein
VLIYPTAYLDRKYSRNFPVKNTNNQTQRPGNEKNYLKIRLIETDRSITAKNKTKITGT